MCLWICSAGSVKRIAPWPGESLARVCAAASFLLALAFNLSGCVSATTGAAGVLAPQSSVIGAGPAPETTAREPVAGETEALETAQRRSSHVYGSGRMEVDAEEPDESALRAGAFASASPSILSTPSGASAPAVSAPLPAASSRLPAPATYGALGDRVSAPSIAGFDAIGFPLRYSSGSFISHEVEFEPELPEFLTDSSRAAACHPLLRLAPGLVCSPWIADTSLHALASPDGAGAAWRFSEGVELSAFTRHRGRLHGAASDAFPLEGGSSLAALHLDREWPLDETGHWRMEGTFTLAADLPRGSGEHPDSMLEAGPALLSDWSIGVTHDQRNLHTRLSLSQPPRAETGYARLTLPDGRRGDGTPVNETRRFSLVPPRRQLTLKLAHQRPFAGGDVVVSVLRTENRGHTRAPRRYVGGIAWRRSF